jgi:hypothetical protein
MNDEGEKRDIIIRVRAKLGVNNLLLREWCRQREEAIEEGAASARLAAARSHSCSARRDNRGGGNDHEDSDCAGTATDSSRQ